MIVSVKGSVVLLASALPVLFSRSHALPREIAGRSTSPPELKTLTPSLGWIPTPSSCRITAAVRARQAHQHVPTAIAAGDTEAGASIVPSRVHPRIATICCRTKGRRTGPVYVAGVEGGPSASASAPAAPAAAASSALDVSPPAAAETTSAAAPAEPQKASPITAVGAARAPASPGIIAIGTVGSPVVEGEDGREFVSATSIESTTTKTTTILNEGEATCRHLQGVSREAEVAGHRVCLRVATLDDYLAIADVRFDVFSPVHSTLKHRFRERSCLLMRERRRRGAFCLVAALEQSPAAGDRVEKRVREEETLEEVIKDNKTAVSEEHVLGTLECSRHEFDGTPLALGAEDGEGKIARLYLTEVAVRSDCRRLGVGCVLLGFVDDVAKQLDTSEVFLHVNEINDAALRLYSRCGYEEAPDCASNRVFTNSLGLAGGFIGQRHRLLHKTFQAGDRASTSAASMPAA